MAKIIFTSRYFRNPKRSNVGKLVKYMGTREGVEKLPNGIDNSPSTKSQQRVCKKTCCGHIYCRTHRQQEILSLRYSEKGLQISWIFKHK